MEGCCDLRSEDTGENGDEELDMGGGGETQERKKGN